jgi:hypothetical protein
MFSFLLWRFFPLYLRKFRLKPCPYALPDHPQARIAVQEDRTDDGFHGVGKDRFFP